MKKWLEHIRGGVGTAAAPLNQAAAPLGISRARSESQHGVDIDVWADGSRVRTPPNTTPPHHPPNYPKKAPQQTHIGPLGSAHAGAIGPPTVRVLTARALTSMCAGAWIRSFNFWSLVTRCVHLLPRLFELNLIMFCVQQGTKRNAPLDP